MRIHPSGHSEWPADAQVWLAGYRADWLAGWLSGWLSGWLGLEASQAADVGLGVFDAGQGDVARQAVAAQ